MKRVILGPAVALVLNLLLLLAIFAFYPSKSVAIGPDTRPPCNIGNPGCTECYTTGNNMCCGYCFWNLARPR
jgi:hypothetical protein